MMGKLSLSPSRAAFSSARLSAPPKNEAPAPSLSSRPWKAKYDLKQWRSLRQEVLLRDGYTCRHCQRVCVGKSPAANSPVVDHIRPHRGDDRLFWDKGNLQTLCKSPCHDQHKQRLEQESRSHQGVWD